MAIVIKNKKPETAAPKVQIIKESVAYVVKQHKDGSTEETKEVINTQVFNQPTANVGMAISLTKNLGNYESIKLTVSLNMPCLPTAEDLDQTFMEVKGWVDAKVDQINTEVNAQIG